MAKITSSHETVEFDGCAFHRYPHSKCPSDRKYFKGWWMHNGKRKKEYLHRAMWIKENGEIPKGFHVHHTDENYNHNILSNFELKTTHKHLSDHWHSSSEAFKEERKKDLLTKAIPASKEWHSSEEVIIYLLDHAKF